jgi:esterase/lipase superfamily enzyme
MRLAPAARTVAVMALSMLLLGCAKQLLMCPRTVKMPRPPPPQQHPAVVLFATDRLAESRENLSFLGELNPSGSHMSYGAKCADPAGGKGGCDVPSSGLERDEFLQQITAARSDVVLFVHGFNYTFDESLEIALRIVERAKFPATPVAYSWPSQGKVSSYDIDYDMSEWTIYHLTDFIRDLSGAVPEGSHLHIVAHSMGNRALLMALARLDLAEPRLGQLILIAPDVDTKIFKELVLQSGPFQRKTLYVSQHDLALRAAGFLRSSTIRAGDATKQYVVVKDIDTVDMTPLKAGVTGHSLYDYPQSMFDDLGAVLRDETVAGRNLTACTVKSIQSMNVANGTSQPCVVFRLPSH